MLFDIQHFSLQDGPGVRTTVFFKGCPLHCKWCSNPESQSARPEILYYGQLCKHCGLCAENCPAHALWFDGMGRLHRSSACTACGQCADICPHEATTKSGFYATVEEICRNVDEDWRIMTQSGGGVTVSGGEPLAQPQFLASLLKALHEDHGFHTCMETTAFAPWEHLERAMQHLDMMYVDLKHMFSLYHRTGTGQDNALILENVKRLSKTGMPVTIRIPLIPRYNDTLENIEALAAFMAENNLHDLEIMPQHNLGKSKYAALGREYQIREDLRPDVENAVETVKKYNISAMVLVH